MGPKQPTGSTPPSGYSQPDDPTAESTSSEKDFSEEEFSDQAFSDEELEETVMLTIPRLLTALENGQMEERGLLPYSSNYSFLVTITDDDLVLPAVYKPRRGENPLWDFPSGTLCQRETAAFEVSSALGWDLVPPTVLREGTRGIGSVQFYIDCDPNVHYFTAREDARFAQTMRQLVLFDYIINNADRKSGHCLIGFDDRMWAIDHGICFHHQYKLRTVIWEFSGECIEPAFFSEMTAMAEALDQPASELNNRLHALISPPEWTAMRERLATLLTSGIYPNPLPYQRNFPWPPV